MAATDDNDLGFVTDEELGFVSEPDPVPTQPGPQASANPDTLDSIGRGAAQGASLMFGDEASGVLQAGYSGAERALENLKQGKILDPEAYSFLAKEYIKHRDAERIKNDTSAANNPVAYGATRALSAIPSAVATAPLTGAKAATAGLPLLAKVANVAKAGAGSAVVGAVSGAAGSDAPLVSTDTAKSAALGGVVGQAGGSFPTVAKYGLPVAGAGLAAFGDEIGMTDADRVSAGVGAAAGLPGMAGDVLERMAAKTVAPAQRARTQLADEIQAGDVVDDAADAKTMNALLDAKRRELEAKRSEAVRGVRSQEDEEFRTQEKLRALNEKEAQVQERRGFKDAKAKVDEYDQVQAEANRLYQDWFKSKVKDIQLRAKARQDHAKTRGDLLKAQQDAEAEYNALLASADGSRAQAFQTAVTRMTQYKALTGEELPPDGQELWSKAANSYKDNSNFPKLDPDYVKGAILDQGLPPIQAKIQSSRDALAKFDATPFDEDAAVTALLKKTSPVDKTEAYKKAQELGLDPGDLNAFDPVPNKARVLSLNRPRPEAPEALPSPEERALAKIEADRARLNGEVPGPVRKPEIDIWKELGLDSDATLTGDDFLAKADGRAPVPDRVSERVEWARPGAEAQVKLGAMKGGAVGAAVGGGAGVVPNVLDGAPVGLLGGSGSVVGGAAGAFLGARGAIRALSAIDPKTGRFKEPAAVAAVMESIGKALVKYPNLGKKYFGLLAKGVRPAQVMFYIKNDPELARALDEGQEN